MVSDGVRSYKTVVIYGQTWMAENLNYNASGSKCGNGSSLSDENTETCDTYGRLYNWATAMNNSASSSANPSGVRGVCPEGWHIPSDAEWNNIGGSSTAGTKLKKATSWKISGIAGTDDFGFAALPGGYGNSDGDFFNAGDVGRWWSSSEYSGNYAWGRGMSYLSEYVYRDYHDKRYNLFSVRCLQD
jgi:uncharacterized protein (TIGR02145 family)